MQRKKPSKQPFSVQESAHESLQIVGSGLFSDGGAVPIHRALLQVHQLRNLLGAKVEVAQHAKLVLLHGKVGVGRHHPLVRLRISAVKLGKDPLQLVLFLAMVERHRPLLQHLLRVQCGLFHLRLKLSFRRVVPLRGLAQPL